MLTYAEQLERRIRQHVRGNRVGFLLGAGSSFLNGAGYPLAGALWHEISSILPPGDSATLGGILAGRQLGLEQALDVLDVDPAMTIPSS